MKIKWKEFVTRDVANCKVSFVTVQSKRRPKMIGACYKDG